MKKEMLVIGFVFLMMIINVFGIYAMDVGECGDGVCSEDEQNYIIYCSTDYPFGLEHEMKNFCSQKTCFLDCGNKYYKNEIKKEILHKQMICGDVPCQDIEGGILYEDIEEEFKGNQICGDGICQEIEKEKICKYKAGDKTYDYQDFMTNKYSLNKEEQESLFCQTACPQDCNSIALKSGKELPLDPIKLPIKIDNPSDFFSVMHLNEGECGGSGISDNGEIIKLGLCLNEVTNEGVWIKFRFIKDREEHISENNIGETEKVFIKYYESYNSGVDLNGGHDIYLVPTYNSLISFSISKNYITLFFKRIFVGGAHSTN